MMKYEFNDAYLAVHYKFITGFTSAKPKVLLGLRFNGRLKTRTSLPRNLVVYVISVRNQSATYNFKLIVQ
jgi:hypothetical protein